jgi:putative GTP pyrophosphokinase
MLECILIMEKEMSKTQVDRLGDRLRKGNINEADLRLLDIYRRSFSDAYQVVVGTIIKELALEPTGRPAKSTTSISDKLRRESIRLTQIQDIAGCRLIVPDIVTQDSVVESLKSLFEHTSIVDRRKQPSHGYRAVHVIASYRDKLIEIQVRTSLQHLWAELSEKFSDIVDPVIKYGGGGKDIQALLSKISSTIAMGEFAETQLADAQAQLSSLDSLKYSHIQQKIVGAQDELILLKRRTLEVIQDAIDHVESLKGESDDLSD